MSGFLPNISARRSLAARFGLPYHDGMQDWEYEVADAARFPEFLQAYRHASLSDSERESLMEMMMQCVEDRLRAVPQQPLESLPEWQPVAGLLLQRASLHAATIDYWSCLEEAGPELVFCRLRTDALFAGRFAAAGVLSTVTAAPNHALRRTEAGGRLFSVVESVLASLCR